MSFIYHHNRRSLDTFAGGLLVDDDLVLVELLTKTLVIQIY